MMNNKSDQLAAEFIEHAIDARGDGHTPDEVISAMISAFWSAFLMINHNSAAPMESFNRTKALCLEVEGIAHAKTTEMIIMRASHNGKVGHA
jgi:hypothetical protein